MFHILNGSAEERESWPTVCRSGTIDVDASEHCINMYVYAKYAHEGDGGERSAQSRTYVKNRSTDRSHPRGFVTENRFRRGPSLNRRSSLHWILISATMSRSSVRLSTDKKMHRTYTSRHINS